MKLRLELIQQQNELIIVQHQNMEGMLLKLEDILQGMQCTISNLRKTIAGNLIVGGDNDC